MISTRVLAVSLHGDDHFTGFEFPAGLKHECEWAAILRATIFGAQHVKTALPDDLVAWPAGQLLGRAIEARDHELAIDGDDRVKQRVQDRLQVFDARQ